MSKIATYYKKLAGIFGPSGREQEIAKVLMEMAKPWVDTVTIDALGNCICHKKGTGKKLMFAAHMDSLGVVATYIDEKGFIRFSPVGGIAIEDLIHRRVRFANGTCGVIAKEEKVKLEEVKSHQCYIDIGATTQEQAEAKVQVGDFAVWDANPMEQDGILIGPYLDNRIGCVVLLLLMEALQDSPNDLSFVFTVQEEVGLRGAGVATYATQPDYAVAVDVTDTGDVPGCVYPMAVSMGKGPAIKRMDASVLCSPKVCDMLVQSAQACGIAVQQEILRQGGTDTAAIQRSRAGVLTGALSIPTRYIHTPYEMCSTKDVEQAVQVFMHFANTQWT